MMLKVVVVIVAVVMVHFSQGSYLTGGVGNLVSMFSPVFLYSIFFVSLFVSSLLNVFVFLGALRTYLLVDMFLRFFFCTLTTLLNKICCSFSYILLIYFLYPVPFVLIFG